MKATEVKIPAICTEFRDESDGSIPRAPKPIKNIKNIKHVQNIENTNNFVLIKNKRDITNLFIGLSILNSKVGHITLD